MSCVSPLVRIDGWFFDNHSLFKFLPKKKCYRGGYFYDYKSFFDLFDNVSTRDKYLSSPYVSLIPCGRCMACQLKYSKDWAMRVALESERFEFNYFITLTYDDKYIKRKDFITNDKEVFNLAYLDKRDIQLFIKRIRRDLGEDMKYFLCGEYGGTSARPHYHLIIMSHKEIPNLEFIYNDCENAFFNSSFISDKWDYGFHTISTSNLNTIFYTSHYCLKKVGKEKLDLIDSNGVSFQNEFRLMSRNPGLGSDYFYSKVVPNYLDLTTFKYKDFSIDIRYLQYYDYMFHKHDIYEYWKDRKDTKMSQLVNNNDKYIDLFEKEAFKSACNAFDKMIFRNKC